MPHHAFAFGRVNLLKKVRVDGEWKFCPAVVEPGRRLNDLVRVNGHIETHPEGTYYLDWREQGKRRRQPVRNRALVCEQARLKALQLEAQRSGREIGAASSSEPAAPPDPPPAASLPSAAASSSISATHLILKGMESYLEAIVGAEVRSQLAALGLMPQNAGPAVPIPPSTINPPTPIPSDEKRSEPGALPTSSNASSTPKVLITEAIESYLNDVAPPQREQKTYDEYRLVLGKFRDSCRKRYLDEINRDDCLAFMRHLYSLGNEARTVFNRMGIVLQLLKLHGIEKLLNKRDKPKFVKNVREMYQPEDLEALFQACTADEKVLYWFFLLTGERDKEVRHTAWPDIDFARKVVRVTAKKRLGFKPKDKEEREIPVPASLLSALREYRARQSGPNPHNLLFPTGRGKADRKFENKLKRIANRAGLNCERCISKHGNKCNAGPHCGRWFLHKFRHTYATTCLESGVSIRTLQEWLGHSDLASTMVYLKYVRRKDIQQLVDNSEMAVLAAHGPVELASKPPEQVKLRDAGELAS